MAKAKKSWVNSFYRIKVRKQNMRNYHSMWFICASTWTITFPEVALASQDRSWSSELGPCHKSHKNSWANHQIPTKNIKKQPACYVHQLDTKNNSSIPMIPELDLACFGSGLVDRTISHISNGFPWGCVFALSCQHGQPRILKLHRMLNSPTANERFNRSLEEFWSLNLSSKFLQVSGCRGSRGAANSWRWWLQLDGPLRDMGSAPSTRRWPQGRANTPHWQHLQRFF